MDHVQEFQSPSIRSEGMVVYALLLLAAVALAARAEPFEAVLVLLWGFASLRSARHVPLFALVAAPVVADAAAELWRRAAETMGRRSAVVAAARLLAAIWDARPRLSALAGGLGRPADGAAGRPSGFPDSRFPVDAVERNLSRLTPAGESLRAC